MAPDVGWSVSFYTRKTHSNSAEREKEMRIQSGVIVPLGYGKYVRSDRVTSVVPIEDERGPGRRTFVFVEEQKEPLVASRAEDSLVRDLVSEPREVTRSRQQQEILRDLIEDLATVNQTVRDIVRDRSSLDLNVTERRIRDAIDALDEAAEN
jgi:hypothetical protein